jgi:putative ABC transport system permease protein
MWILMRSSGDIATLASRVREAVHSLDAGQPIGELVSMMDVVSRSTATRRFNLLLVGVFAALALGLAVTGIAGVTSYSLSQRTRELGIRVALGADRKRLLSLGLRETLGVVTAGAVLGVFAALGAARALRAMLFEVGPSDPLTYLVVTVLLVAVAITACYLPVQRAAQADPMITLRSE